MSKETFTRDKPHVNIGMIGGAALLIALIIFGASTIFRGQNASLPFPTDTAAPGPTSEPTNTSQGSSPGSYTVNQLWGNWFLYQDECGRSFPALQTHFILHNDGTEPAALTESTLVMTYFGPANANSPDGMPEAVQVFILPNFFNTYPQNVPDPIPPGGELQVLLELSPSHPDFLWAPRDIISPTAVAAGENTLYGRYVFGPLPSSSDGGPRNVLWGDWFIVDSPSSQSDVPAAILLIPYFAVESDSATRTGNQLWGDFVYVDVGSSSNSSAALPTQQIILWGDYVYKSPPGGDGPADFKDTSVAVMLLPEIAGLFKDTADGETASTANLVLKRGIPNDDAGSTNDSGHFWFFNPDNVDLIVRATEGQAVGAIYKFDIQGEDGGKGYPVIIGTLPNVKNDDKRPPMTIFIWGTSFPNQINETDLAFLQQWNERIGWAEINGMTEDIQLVEISGPSLCLTPTAETGSALIDTPQSNINVDVTPTPTNTLSLIIQTPVPEKTKPTPTDTLQPSRTPPRTRPPLTPTPTKEQQN